MKYLFAGLGNIGEEYSNTRHNAGMEVIDAWASKCRATFIQKRLGFVATTNFRRNPCLLLKPTTFMNLSGNAVRFWLQKEKIPIQNLLVINDDVALPFGTLRLREKGSDAGHNGIKSIIETLGTEQFSRLRIGIGGDFQRGKQVDYVLGKWTPEEKAQLPVIYNRAMEIIEHLIINGVVRTMTVFNNKNIPGIVN